MDKILSLYCPSPSAVNSEVPLSCGLRVEIRSKGSLLRLAAAMPSEVWVYLVCGGEEGWVRTENLRKLNFQLLSQVSLRRLGGCGEGRE